MRTSQLRSHERSQLCPWRTKISQKISVLGTRRHHITNSLYLSAFETLAMILDPIILEIEFVDLHIWNTNFAFCCDTILLALSFSTWDRYTRKAQLQIIQKKTSYDLMTIVQRKITYDREYHYCE